VANNLEREQARHILLSKFQEAEEKAEREGWLDADEMKLMLKKEARHQSLENRALAYNGKIGPYQEYEWDSPIGREQW